MIVVSDTSPILNLARTGRLDLLALIYHEVFIPSAVSGLIDTVKPVLDELIQTARFWIGADLYEEVLSELGEA